MTAPERMLVTGHRGLVGTEVVRQARAHGWEVVGLDLADGDDLLDPGTTAARIDGCAAVVHLAALDEPEAAADIVRVNVEGTRVLLRAVTDAGVGRLVFSSSVDVFGCFMGQRLPDYLPIDDAHPVRPRGPYAESKLAAEELFRLHTVATGAATICLRPPGIVDGVIAADLRAMRERDPSSEWTPFWEYGAFIDVRDVAAALLAAAEHDIQGHHRLVVAGDDVSSAHLTGPELAARLVPDVPLVDLERFARERWASLLDSTPAQRILGWRPEHRWRPTPIPG